MGRLKYFFILLFLTLSVLVEGKSSYANKIKHVVVLMEENRSFDHMMGWFKGVNGLTGKEYNQVNVSDPASPKVYVGSNAPFVALCDPTHSTPGTTFKIYASESDAGEALMGGFVEYEDRAGHASTNYCAVMEMQSPSHLPILSSLASEFVVMDRFFCAHPGPTWPNRLFMLSATSAGDTETKTFYQDKEGHLYPQKTIFNQVSEAGLQWKNYFNDTPWELFLETIALHPENLFNMEKFYEDARTGDLPAFSWINPRAAINITLKQGSNDQHPDHDVALGERYYKDIYEALRASPAWNDTLYIITYDEHGGFYDHVLPPVNVPAPDNSTSYPDKDFLFNRLGVRIPTLLISPWLPKGLVQSSPPAAQKPYNNSEYSLTSIMATARILLGMPNNPLTMRDKWSATFEHLFEILDSPRTDCPLHLPDAPPPATREIEEEDLPINDLQKTIMEMHANLAGVEFPVNVVKQGQVSEWLQAQYSKHADNTFNWKRHKTSLPQFYISSQPLSFNYSHSSHWQVNKGIHHPYFTLSTRGAMCLDFKERENTKREVGVSPCYPREDADSSLDHSQRWIWGDNLSLRPFSLILSQCLTRESDGMIGLSKCDGSKEQRWNWEESSCGEKSEMGEIRWFDSDERVVIRKTK